MTGRGTVAIREKSRRLISVLNDEGVLGAVGRAAVRANNRWGDTSERLNLLPEHVADSSNVQREWELPRGRAGSRLTVGWVVSGPAEGSGGHTTIFRMVEALERAGHRCIIFIYDGVGSPASRYEGLIRRWWPQVRAAVLDVGAGLRGCDAYVATAWPTAHVLASQGALPGARLYLAQDYEPFFYARGSAYELAAESYRFGFKTITIGRMVAEELRKNHGVHAVVAPFGCDTASYRSLSDGRRSGVVFYAKPGVARRGYELAVLALRLFSMERPDIPIHAFGIRARHLPFEASVHAHMTPAELNQLYNRCSAGIALSFTNISLIATELLAAGISPVVNDHVGSRADLENPYVAWSRATPRAICDAISWAHETHVAQGPARIAESVSEVSWEPAKQAMVEAIIDACRIESN